MDDGGRSLTALLLSLPAYAETKTVTVWSWFIQSTMNKSIAAFEKEHPDIQVKYVYYNYSPDYITALKAASASGSLPDVIGLQPGSLTQQYRPDLAPLSDKAAASWGASWADKVFPVNRKQMLMGNPQGDRTLDDTSGSSRCSASGTIARSSRKSDFCPEDL